VVAPAAVAVGAYRALRIIGMAGRYAIRYGPRILPYASQAVRGFGRGLVPVWGSVTNLQYAARLSPNLAGARLGGGLVGDAVIGSTTLGYAIKLQREAKSPLTGMPRSPGIGGRARRKTRRGRR
jgi:hypothetical protein